MINEIIDLSLKNLKCVVLNRQRNPETKVWRSFITINEKRKYLGLFNDPFSACLVYCFVKEEITGRNPIKNRFISLSSDKKRWEIRKTINGKLKRFNSFHNLEDARIERDLLEKYNWSLDKVCECADETINGNIIFNNYLVGVKI